jgi:DNA-binding MarR family transcriptional regulator
MLNNVVVPYRQITTYQTVIAQARAYRKVRSFMDVTLKPYNLTITEWLIIGTSIDAGPTGIRISELAKKLGVEMPVVTNLVHKATNTGWLRRIEDPVDKRARRVVMTHAGLEKACDIEGELKKATAPWLKDIDAVSMKGFYEVISELSGKDVPA